MEQFPLKSYSPLQNPLLQKTTTTYKESHISFVEVVGHKCEAEPARTEMIEPSQPWRTFSLDFTVPEKCYAMMVRVRRTASLQIDNQLGGELWLAELGLTPTTIAIAPLKEVTP